MKVKSINGQEMEISIEEARRIAELVEHHCSCGTKSDFAHKMRGFFTHYQHTAAENIQRVIGSEKPPMREEDVKEAIAMVFAHGSADDVAEVVFEASEWETAYANLKSIE
jgi:hypothetical protein